MSAFVTKADYKTNIRGDLLDTITRFDDDILEAVERATESMVKSYLNTRYLVDEIFSKTGSDRHAKVLDVCLKITLYELHRLVNPQRIPEFREQAYEDAMIWLRGLKNGSLDAPDLPRPTTNEKDYILFGSNPKRDNRF